MDNTTLVKKFYDSFAAGDADQMTGCYHDEITFSDPAFGTLQGDEAKAMWHMLLGRTKGPKDITYTIIEAAETNASIQWTATYPYGPKKRIVVNKVTAHCTFKDGKIIEHHDTFNLYTWSKQAMGLTGYLLGWTGFMRSKIQAKTNGLLKAYMSRQ